MRDNLTREGEIGELRVQLDLTEQGGVVSVPASASTNGYDLIYDSVAKNNRGQTHRYAEQVDFIAVHVKGTSDIYYLPSEILPENRVSETFLLPHYEGRSGKIRLGTDHRSIK